MLSFTFVRRGRLDEANELETHHEKHKLREALYPFDLPLQTLSDVQTTARNVLRLYSPLPPAICDKLCGHFAAGTKKAMKLDAVSGYAGAVSMWTEAAGNCECDPLDPKVRHMPPEFRAARYFKSFVLKGLKELLAQGKTKMDIVSGLCGEVLRKCQELGNKKRFNQQDVDGTYFEETLTVTHGILYMLDPSCKSSETCFDLFCTLMNAATDKNTIIRVICNAVRNPPD